MTRRSIPFAALAVMYLGVVAVLTLGPAPWRTGRALSDYDVLSPSTWLDPDTWVRVGSAEFVANILLFLPLGVLLRLAVPRAGWLVPVALGTALSIGIEVLQMGSPRVSDPRDVVANSAGALTGVVIASVILAVSRRVSGARGLPHTRRELAGARTVTPDSDLTRAAG
jgi:glycopeptide antibiotics resistance protein